VLQAEAAASACNRSNPTTVMHGPINIRLLTHVASLANNFEKNCLKFSSLTIKIIAYQVDI